MINYKTKCSILAELWSNYRDDEEFKEFIEYNDLGLPLAYLLAEGLVTEIVPEGQLYINETFNIFIAALNVEEEELSDDMSLNDLFVLAEKKLS